jgi:formylglycine-generating enzyme required for sulfatase activity
MAEVERAALPLSELVRRLEAKMLPVPGTKIMLSKTEFTVGEWKLYLKAKGLPDWQSRTQFEQNDEHPVVNVSWYDAKQFCDWLRYVTGKEWRLPTNLEWEAAVGTSRYPWGDYYPPKWDDGNYRVAKDGKLDPATVGVDGIKGTAPVGSFKASVLGFYDLGGNVGEWMWDGLDEKTGRAVTRGGSWFYFAEFCSVATRGSYDSGFRTNDLGFRVALSSVP